MPARPRLNWLAARDNLFPIGRFIGKGCGRVLKAVKTVACSCLLFVGALIAEADEFDGLWQMFDPAPLSYSDRRFLQAALSFEGHYNGLLDGAWGGLSQRAMENYSRKEYGSEPRRWHAGMLAFSFLERIQQNGWEIIYNDALGMSFFFPGDSVRKGTPSEHFSNWEHAASSLKYSVMVADWGETSRLHEITAERHRSANPIYRVRKNHLAVTKSQDADGLVVYTRSNFINGSWSTIMLSASRRDQSLVDAIASSISVGRAPPLTIPDGGWLAETIRLSVAFDESSRQTEPESAANVNRKPRQERDGADASGSGFVVTKEGDILTNAHVVSQCERILVDELTASLTAISTDFDLALLRSDEASAMEPAKFADDPARLNSDVSVVGYPLYGLLGGLNVTRGSVSSATGVLGDGIRMQISAPVQPGNSGGPVLASNGAVVGVVVSKLDTLRVAEAIGDIPQNVNFAIRGEIAKLFLFQNGVEPDVALQANDLAPEDLAELAKKFTVRVTCEN